MILFNSIASNSEGLSRYCLPHFLKANVLLIDESFFFRCFVKDLTDENVLTEPIFQTIKSINFRSFFSLSFSKNMTLCTFFNNSNGKSEAAQFLIDNFNDSIFSVNLTRFNFHIEPIARLTSDLE